MLGPRLSVSEVYGKAEVSADGNRPRNDFSMYKGDLYQESVKLPEPPFPFLRRYGCPRMARPVLPLLIGLWRNFQSPVRRSRSD